MGWFQFFNNSLQSNASLFAYTLISVHTVIAAKQKKNSRNSSASTPQQHAGSELNTNCTVYEGNGKGLSSADLARASRPVGSSESGIIPLID